MTERCNSRKRGCPPAQPQAQAGPPADSWNGHSYCQQPAGWGTDHPGTGRCKLHGGNHRAGPAHPRWKHGHYAESVASKLSPALRKAYQEGLEDPELVAGRADIQLANLYVQHLIEGLAKNESAGGFREIASHARRGLKALDKAELETVKLNFQRILRATEDPIQFDRTMSQVMGVLENKRRLQVAERERLVQLQQMLQLKDLDGIILFISKAVHEALHAHVTDQTQIDGVLAQLARELRIRGDLAGVQATGYRRKDARAGPSRA